MSSGSINSMVLSSSPYYYHSPPSLPEFQGNANFYNGTQKTWSGGDRVKTIETRRPRVRRFYYTLRTRTFINKRGRMVTKTYRIRKSYTVLAAPRPRKSSSVPNAYSMSITRRIETPHDGYNAIANQYIYGVSPTAFGADPSFVPESYTFTANDDIRLINKLSEQIRGSDFNAAVFLAEGSKSLEMIGNAAIKLAAGLRHVKKGNLNAAMQAFTGRKPVVKGKLPRPGYAKSKSIEKTWLESSYGWQPLLKDIHGGAEMLANIVNSSMVKRYQVRTTKKGVLSDIFPPRANDSAKCVSRKQIIAYITKKESLANQLSLLDPASVAWELLPFSFVFDWFLPVGNFLQARSFANSDMEGTFVTSTTLKVQAKGLKNYFNNYFYSGVYEYTYVSMTRTVASSLNVPFPEFVPMNKILSWKRAANAVALISVLRPKDIFK